MTTGSHHYSWRKNWKKKYWTIVGTVKKNQPEIPNDLLQCCHADVSVAKHVFQNMKTLCCYVPKEWKIVVLLSTAHHRDAVKNEISGKPQIIEDYNANKGGVDMFNEMVKGRTVRRKTRRWPLRVFYFILDASAYNSLVLFRENNEISRIEFLKKLSISLVEKYTKIRLEKHSNFSLELRTTITIFRRAAYGVEIEEQKEEGAQPRTRSWICSLDYRGRNSKRQLFFAACAIGQYVGNTMVKLLFARNAPINFCI